MTLFDAWLIVTAFALGRWSVERGTRFRMGQKVLSNVEKVLNQRKIVGDGGLSVGATIKWQFESHNWELTVTQESKEGVQ